jgi:hypothetical protein
VVRGGRHHGSVTNSLVTTAAAPSWLTYVTALSALAVALFTFLVGPYTEVRKLRGQRGESERQKLRELIEKYHARLLEAAVDWDRRMHQLYEHEPVTPRRGEPYPKRSPDDPHAHALSHLRGVDFLEADQYLFRSYVFRFLALCALARKFEAEAFYIDAQYARRQDLDFLKFTKALLWAMTTSDISADEFPGQSHFPNDQFRPLLDRCYRTLRDGLPHVVDGGEQREVIFDLAFLHELVEGERRFLYGDDHRERKTLKRRAAHRNGDGEDADAWLEEGDLSTPGDLHKVLAYFDGVHRDTEYNKQEQRLRVHRWDRLCVLHLLVMAFINEFGYEWQVSGPDKLQRAVDQIVDPRTAGGFLAAYRELGFDQPTSWWQRRREEARPGMDDIRVMLADRVERAREPVAEPIASGAG